MTTRFRWLSWLLGVGILDACAARADMVVISEIMYHPAGVKPEYFVLLNNSATPFDIAGWRVTEGVRLELPGFSTNDPAATFLRPHERIVLSAESAAATRAAYRIPATVRVYGPWEGRLSNEGERITVQDKNGTRVSTVKYGARGHWSPAADGAGHALEIKDPNGTIDDWRNWTVSVGPDVTPGVAPKRVVSGGAAALRLNEVHFATAQHVDWLEVYNPLPTPVSLNGVYWSARRDFDDRVALTGEIAPQSCRSWDVSGHLKKGEVTLYLLSEGRAVLDCRAFGRPTLGDTWQAFPDGARDWFAATNSTRDAANRPARQTDVVINEIMFDPPGVGVKGEFVELFNRGTNDIDLSGWALTEGVRFTFPAGMTISASGFLVVAGDTHWMRATYGDIPLAGDFAGKIRNHGELIRLVDAVGNLAGEVDFNAGGAWPELAKGGGSSLELLHPGMDGRRASAWHDSDEGGKSAFQTYAWTNTYLELNPVGEPTDYRELHFHLVGEGHVALRNIALVKDGTNFILNGTRLSTNELSDGGWLCQGTHWASFMAQGEFHIVADGRGDNRGNRVEIDVPGIRPNQTYSLQFEARWISGTPRLIAQSWDHSLGHSFLLEVPKDLGTPGRVNSRFLPGPAPEVESIRHHPAVPRSTDAVKVCAQVFSAAPLRAVRLCHRSDSETGTVAWQSELMQPDLAAGEGVFSAELTGRRTNGQVIQFYVEAVAENGQSAVLPGGGAQRPAMLVVDDRAFPRDLRTARVVVSARDLGALARGGSAEYGFRFPRLSNHSFNGTFIADEDEIFYGAKVRNSGSPRTREGDLRKMKFKLPGDRPFRGRTKFAFDDDAAVGTAYHNRVARYLLYLLGHPANENEFVRAVVNAGPIELREDVEPVGKEFLSRHFADGSHGELYRIDDEWRFLDHGAGLNEDADWVYKDSDDAGRYRTEWMKRSRETEDDFSRLIALFQTLAKTNGTPREIERFLDVPAVLKLAAVRGVIGDWDNFTMQRGRNGYLYRRPADGLFQFLHWDSDEAFLTGQPLYGERMRGLLEQPEHRKMFFGFVTELLHLCAEDPARFKTWLEVQKEASGPDIVQASYLNFFRIRAPEARQAMGEHPTANGQTSIAPSR